MSELGIACLADYCRLKVLGKSAVPLIQFPEVNAEAAESLRSLHSNLNQLVRQLYISEMDERDLISLKRSVAKLDRVASELRDLLCGYIPYCSIFALAREKLSLDHLEKIVAFRKQLKDPRK